MKNFLKHATALSVLLLYGAIRYEQLIPEFPRIVGQVSIFVLVGTLPVWALYWRSLIHHPQGGMLQASIRMLLIVLAYALTFPLIEYVFAVTAELIPSSEFVYFVEYEDKGWIVIAVIAGLFVWLALSIIARIDRPKAHE